MASELLIARLSRSLLKLTGRALFPGPVDGARDIAAAAFNAPFVLLAHGTEVRFEPDGRTMHLPTSESSGVPPPCLLCILYQADPLLCYGNAAALALFELSPEALVGMPSRLTAEAPERAERQRLLDGVAALGFVDDYCGVRVSSSGRRFRISGATVWEVHDEAGARIGQGAMFSNWERLDETPAPTSLVHVLVRVRPGTGELFRALTLANARASRSEAGNLRFDVLAHRYEIVWC